MNKVISDYSKMTFPVFVVQSGTSQPLPFLKFFLELQILICNSLFQYRSLTNGNSRYSLFLTRERTFSIIYANVIEISLLPNFCALPSVPISFIRAAVAIFDNNMNIRRAPTCMSMAIIQFSKDKGGRNVAHLHFTGWFMRDLFAERSLTESPCVEVVRSLGAI